MIELGTDTTRAIASLLFSGQAQKFSDINWIFSHAGGTLLFPIERFERQARVDTRLAVAVPNGVEAELRRFFYDTAQAKIRAAMAALAAVVPSTQVVTSQETVA